MGRWGAELVLSPHSGGEVQCSGKSEYGIIIPDAVDREFGGTDDFYTISTYTSWES